MTRFIDAPVRRDFVQRLQPPTERMRASHWTSLKGEMGERVRSFDWARTPLGPVSSWPQSLCTAVDLMLSSPQPVFIAWGTELVSLYNDGYIPILGAKHPDALGEKFSRVWAEVWAEYAGVVAAALSGEAQFFLDQPMALVGRPGPALSYFTFSFTPLRDDEEQIAGFYCSAVETTSKVLAEQQALAMREAAMRKSESRYRTLFDSMDEGFCVVQVIFDEIGAAYDFRYLEINPAFEKQTGMKNALGRTVRELLPDIEPTWVELYGEVARTGETRRKLSYSEALRRWFDVYAFRIDAPEEGRVAVLFNDVTERHEAEQRWRNTIEIKTVGVLYWAEDFTLKDMNEAFLRMTGFAREEALGKTWQELTPPEFFAASIKAVEEVMTSGETTPYEKQYFRKDGSRWWGLFAARRVGRDIVEFVLDVSERRHAEDALRVADRRKDEFLATLAHELRNPLAALGAAAELMNKAAQRPEVVAMARDVLQRQVAHMARLLDDLLDVARITHGLVQLQLERTDLADVIRAVADTVRPQLEAKRHRLTLRMPAHRTYVNADPVRLNQVIGNLLNNAAKYTPAHGHIEVTLTVDESLAHIKVKDDGIGIESDMLERVFDMFSQGRQIETMSTGLGIGLALVRELVQMHKGRISAKSAGSGRGSEFIVCLPLLSTETSQPSRQPSRVTTQPGESFRILVADDNVDSATSWALILEQSGHDVRTAFEGRAALEEAERFHPQVALLDIGMPHLTGYEVAQRIRETGWGADTTLVAVTGWGHARDREAATEAGFDFHFTKPASANDIDRVLEAARQRTPH